MNLEMNLSIDNRFLQIIEVMTIKKLNLMELKEN